MGWMESYAKKERYAQSKIRLEKMSPPKEVGLTSKERKKYVTKLK